MVWNQNWDKYVNLGRILVKKETIGHSQCTDSHPATAIQLWGQQLATSCPPGGDKLRHLADLHLGEPWIDPGLAGVPSYSCKGRICFIAPSSVEVGTVTKLVPPSPVVDDSTVASSSWLVIIIVLCGKLHAVAVRQAWGFHFDHGSAEGTQAQAIPGDDSIMEDIKKGRLDLEEVSSLPSITYQQNISFHIL